MKNTLVWKSFGLIVLVMVIFGSATYFLGLYIQSKNAEGLVASSDGSLVAEAVSDPDSEESSGAVANDDTYVLDAEEGKEKSMLYLDKTTNRIVKVNLNSRAENNYFVTQGDGLFQDAKISNSGKEIAWISELNGTSYLYHSTIEQLSNTVIDQQVMNKTGDKVSSTSFDRIKFFSPHDRYITYGFTGWEFCEDRYFNLEKGARASVEALWCGSTKWSKSGMRLVRSTSAGIATGNSFALTPSGDISKFADVDWDRVSGAPRIDDDNFEFLAADFIDDNRLVVAGHVGNYGSGVGETLPTKVFVYDDAKKQNELLGEFSSIDRGKEDIVDVIYSTNGKAFLATNKFLYEVRDKSLVKVQLEGSVTGEFDYLYSYGQEGDYLVVAKERYYKPEEAKSKENKVYLINVKDGTIQKFDFNGGVFVGLINL
ncbi:MAG: hypothetical protein WCT32_04285 [Patescibacteria group bacterium]|jgi:hypothetical protein